jgi:hypothetical protein
VGIQDAVVELPAEVVQAPAQGEAVTLETLRREVRAARHNADVRIGEIHGLIGGVLDEIKAMRTDVAAVADRYDSTAYRLTTVIASTTRLERRLVPAAWSGVAAGLATGALVSQLLQAMGGS